MVKKVDQISEIEFLMELHFWGPLKAIIIFLAVGLCVCLFVGEERESVISITQKQMTAGSLILAGVNTGFIY